VLPVSKETSALSLAIDGADHPLLTATSVKVGAHRPSTLVIRCAEARCALP
jgi:hypothetical protein